MLFEIDNEVEYPSVQGTEDESCLIDSKVMYFAEWPLAAEYEKISYFNAYLADVVPD